MSNKKEICKNFSVNFTISVRFGCYFSLVEKTIDWDGIFTNLKKDIYYQGIRK